MTIKKGRRISQIFLVAVSVVSLMQAFSFEDSLVQKASADSIWMQTTQADFLAGTGGNVNITPDGNVTLEMQRKFIEDDFFNESKIVSKRRTIVDTDYGELRLNRFSKLFGNDSVDQGFWVNQTMDGGYIIAGCTNSYGAGSFDTWLIKTDASGNKIWDKTYGGSLADYGRMALPTSDGGYIMVGDTQSFGGSDPDFWLIKTNETGIEQWNKTFGGSSADVGKSVQITNDNGYILSGYTDSYGPGNSDFWLIKTNETGVEQWNNTFGATGSQDQCNFAQQTSDGGYIMTGHTFMISGLGGQDGWLVKTNEMGVHQWNQFIGNTNDDQCFMVKQTPDGGYILVGDTKSYGPNQNGDALLVKTNSNGVQQWYKNYGGYYHDVIYSVTIKSDGGYILGGGTLSYGAGGGDSWIIETDSSGNGLWYKLCGGTNDDYVRSHQQIEDGSIVTVGYTLNFGAGNYDLWFFKTNSLGNDTWDKTFGGSSDDYSYFTSPTSDGSIMALGTTQSYGDSNGDAWLILTNATGEEQWNKTYGGNLGDGGRAVLQTSDGGYFFTANTLSYGAGGTDVWLVKINSTGSEQWNKTIGSGSDDIMYNMVGTSDGGYIIVGYTDSYGAGAYDVWLVKTNATGVEQWNNTFGGILDDYGHSVQQTSDGGYIITGQTDSFGSGGSDGWIIKTDDVGVEQWNKTRGLTWHDYSYSVQETSDGDFIFAGYSNPDGNDYDIWLFKTDSSGNPQWTRRFERVSDINSDYSYSVQQTPDGGYIITGYTQSYSQSVWDGYLLKTDSSGIEQWWKTFAGSNNDYLYSVGQTNEGGYIATGYTTSFGAVANDVWLIKDDTSWGEAVSVNLLEGDSAYSIDNFTCDVIKPPRTAIRVQFSQDNQSWYNSTGSVREWDILSNGSNVINLSSLGWNSAEFYYRVNFHSDGWETAALTNINLTYQRYFQFGKLESMSFDSGGEPSWRTLSWNGTTPVDTEIKFQLRTATTMGGLSAKNFVGPDGTPSTYYTVSGTNIWAGHNGEQWMQYKAVLSANNGTITPVLHNVTIQFNLVPGQPGSLIPIDNLLTNDTTPYFSWSFNDTDSTQESFQLIIDDGSSFTSINYDSGEQISSNEYWQFPDGTGYTSMADGIWFWKVRTRDSDGNWSAYSPYQTLKIDATAPDPPIGISADPGAWNSTNSFNVSWTNPSDLAGITGAYYKLDSPPTSNTDGIYVNGIDITFVDSVAVSSEGNHTIYVWLNDSFNNKNHMNYSVTYLLYDFSTPGPPMDLTANPNTWNNTNSFTVSWTNPSEVSGIAGAYYKLDNPPTFNTDGSLILSPGINSISSIPVLGDGAHTIYIWLLDNASNIDFNNFNTTILYYDGTAPDSPISLTANPSTWTVANSFSVSWTNPVDLSGIVGVYYKLDNPPSSGTDGTYVSGLNINIINSITVSADGQHPIYVWLKDNASNVNQLSSSMTFLYFDGSAPPSPIGILATPSSWTSTNLFTVSWTNPSEHSGIAGAYYSLDFPPTSDADGIYNLGSGINNISGLSVGTEGQHTIYIWLKDNVGNVNYTFNSSTILYFDATAPSSPIGLVANPSSWTSTNSFDLSWTNPGDTSGVSGAYYRLDAPPSSDIDGFLISSPGITSISSVTVSGSGQHLVYVWLVDNAANKNHITNASTILYYDGSAPSSPTAVNATPNSWTPTNSFTVSWTNPTELSGIAGAYFKLDSPPAFNIDGTFIAGAGITSISSISVIGEGQHTIYIWLEDDVGNVDYTSNATTILYWDATPPISPIGISATPSIWTSTNSFTVTWTNPAEVSGIAGAYYKLDTPPTSGTDGTLVSGADITSIGSIVVSGDGQHTIYIWLVDNAGNINHTASNSTILSYDGTAPASPTDLTAIPSTWNSINLFSVTWTNPSEVSGIVGAYYKLDNAPSSGTDGTFVSGVDITSISNIVVSGEGSHPIYIWLIDDAGNTDHTNRNSTNLYYDSSAPSSPISLSATPSSWTSTNSFLVSWTNPTDYSGIAGAYYKLDNPPSSNSDGTLISGQGINTITNIIVSGDGQHPIYVWLIDNAGNINFINSALTELYYDGTAPSSPTSLSASPSSWTSTNSFNISWTNPTDLSGIGGAYYKLDSPPVSNIDGTYVAGSDITSISSITVTGDGQHPIYVWLEDGVGNSNYNTNSSTNLYYDGSAPLPPDNLVVNPSSWTNINSFSLSWTNPSELTGISGAYYKLDLEPTSDIGGTYVSGSGITSISNIQVVGDGQHTIYIWLQDGQDNIDYNNYNTTILYYDSSPPQAPPTITVSPDIWTSTNYFEMDWTEPSDISGIKTGAYYYIGSTPPTSQSLGTWTSDKPFNITYAPEGETNIYIWLEDSVGNKNYLNYATGILKLDSKPPAIQHTFVTAGALEEPITIEADVTDANSGINNVWLFFKKQSAPTYTSQVMTATGDTYTTEITPTTTETMEYFIKAIDNSVSPNIAYYCLLGQVSAEPDTSNDIDITISGEDTIPPEIDGNSPIGSIVSVSDLITITFNEAMDKSSVESAFSISPTVSGNFSWSANTLTFTPDGKLYPETQYTAQIGTTAKDSAGNSLESIHSWQFTTTTDPNQPEVLAISPEGSDVSIESVITVTFSKQMDHVSTEYAFSISPSISGEIEWVGNKLTFTPFTFFNKYTQYTVTIGSEARDTDGYYIPEYSWVFTTRPDEQIDPPRIHSFSPDDGDTDVSVDIQITIQFTKDMDEDVTEDSFSIEPYVDGVFAWDGVILSYTPGESLLHNTKYTVEINRSIARSLDGRLLEEGKEWEFITGEEPEEPGKDGEAASFWDTWEPIITGLTILASFLLALFGFVRLRKKRGKLREYLEKIDETYDEYKDEYQECKQELISLRENIKIEVKQGNLEEGHFLILDKRIDDYLRELRKAKKSGKAAPEEQPSLDEFGGEPEKALVDIGEEEIDIEDEFEDED